MKNNNITLCSASNSFDPAIDQWHELAPYGAHPHAKGLQVFDRASAEALVKAFNSAKNKLKRAFGGIPVYIGHPDDPEFAGLPGHTDTKAYAWVKALEAREEGLWVLAKWSRVGKKLLNNGHYKFLSARWHMTMRPSKDLAPCELISIGLTNNPNIQGQPICNSINSNIQLHTQSKTLSLSNAEKIKKDFTQLVNDRMATQGEDYLRAWTHVKSQYPHLYDTL